MPLRKQASPAYINDWIFRLRVQKMSASSAG